MQNNSSKLYILAFDGVFTWKEFLKKPLKWAIKLFTKSDINHLAYAYSYQFPLKYISQATGLGFESIHYKNVIETRYSKIWAYEFKMPIDFELLDKMTEHHLNDKYEADEAAYSAIDETFLKKIWEKIFGVKKTDKDFSFCNKAVFLLLKAQGYLTDIQDDNSLNPRELIDECNKENLLFTPVLVWNKTHYINNIFDKNVAKSN